MFEWKKGVFFFFSDAESLCHVDSSTRCAWWEEFMMLGHPVLEHKRTYAMLHVQNHSKGLLGARAERNARSLVKMSL